MADVEAGVALAFSTRETMNNINQLSGRFDGLTSVIRRVGYAAAAYLSFRALAHGASSIVRSGMAAENQLTMLETAVGDATRAFELYQEAVRIADVTPFETNEVIESVVRLQAYSINAFEEIGETGINVFTAVGNMAGSMGRSAIQATEAIADAMTGEMERMKEFGITVSMLPPQLRALERGSEAWREGLLRHIATLPRFQGGMERLSQTMGGLLSTMRGFFSNFIRTITGVGDAMSQQSGIKTFFDTLKDSIRGALAWLNTHRDTLLNIARAIGQSLRIVWTVISSIIGLVVRFVQAGIDVFRRWWGAIGEGGDAFRVFATWMTALSIYIEILFEQMGDWIAENKGAIESALIAIVTIIGARLIPVILSLARVILVNLYRSAILIALWAFIDLYRNWDKLTASGKALRIVLLLIGAAFLAFQIVQSVTAAMAAFKVVTIGVNAALWANPIVWIIAAIIALIAIVVLMVKHWDKVKAALLAAWKVVKDFFKGVWEGIKNVAKRVWDTIKSAFTKIWKFIKTVATTIFNFITLPFRLAWDIIKRLFSGESIGSIFSGIANRLKNFFRPFFDWISEKWRGIISFFGGLGTAIGQAFTSAINWVKRQMASVLNFFIRIYNRLASSAVGSRLGMSPIEQLTWGRGDAPAGGGSSGTTNVGHTSSAVIHIHESSNPRDTAAYVVDFMSRRFSEGK